jgi:hypothetical protein
MNRRENKKGHDSAVNSTCEQQRFVSSQTLIARHLLSLSPVHQTALLENTKLQYTQVSIKRSNWLHRLPQHIQTSEYGHSRWQKTHQNTNHQDVAFNTVEMRIDIPKASRDTNATSPGINLKNFFPTLDVITAAEKKPAVFTIP